MKKPRTNKLKPIFMDERTSAKLIEYAARLTLLCGFTVSPSTAARHAIADLLADEVRVLNDLGEPDRQMLREQIKEASVCRGKE